MDSVTQFALGAVIGAVALGPKIGTRKAVIIGGLMGTVPDLDTFLPSEDPVSAFTSHRGGTHSLIVQAIAALLFAEPLVRLFKGLRDHRIFTYLAIYMIFATHALIDAITIYGTRITLSHRRYAIWCGVDVHHRSILFIAFDFDRALGVSDIDLWGDIREVGKAGADTDQCIHVAQYSIAANGRSQGASGS